MKNKLRPEIALWVPAGVFAAFLLAGLVAWLIPQTNSKAGLNVDASAINFAQLKPGANLAELERGRVYYSQFCVPCHGARGDGHGEWAYRVTPRPRDLTSARVRRRSDAFLFSVVSDGLAGSPMSGLKNQLSERQRWQIVGFLRHLGMQTNGQAQIVGNDL